LNALAEDAVEEDGTDRSLVFGRKTPYLSTVGSAIREFWP
jgi:hypothetical protein